MASTGEDPFFVERFVTKLQEVETATGLTNLLQEAANRLGYAHFAYHVVRSPALNQGSFRGTFGLTSYPEKWSRHYIESGFVNHDPIVGRALAGGEPFSWSTVLEGINLTSPQKQIMSDARDAGILDGLTIPLSSRHGEHAILTLVAGPGAVPPVIPATTGLIQLISEFFHSHALRPVLQEELSRDRKRRGSLLSIRERQAMGWAACGKSSWEISCILNIAEKSVEFYIDSAKRKLHASNRTHAVVKALMLGLIDDPSHLRAAPVARSPGKADLANGSALLDEAAAIA